MADRPNNSSPQRDAARGDLPRVWGCARIHRTRTDEIAGSTIRDNIVLVMLDRR